MPQGRRSGFHATGRGTALTYIGDTGGFGANGRFSANGLVTSDRDEFIAWVPACAAPVPISPESCVNALCCWLGDRNESRLANAGGSVPPFLTKVSMEIANGRWLPVAEDGSTDEAEAAVVVHVVMTLVSNLTAPVCAKASPQII